MYDNNGPTQLAVTGGAGSLILGGFSVSLAVVAALLVLAGTLLLVFTRKRSR